MERPIPSGTCDDERTAQFAFALTHRCTIRSSEAVLVGEEKTFDNPNDHLAWRCRECGSVRPVSVSNESQTDWTRWNRSYATQLARGRLDRINPASPAASIEPRPDKFAVGLPLELPNEMSMLRTLKGELLAVLALLALFGGAFVVLHLA